MRRSHLALLFACVLALCSSSSAREKIWTDEVPIGDPQKIEAYLSTVSSALPADEKRILETGLHWIEESVGSRDSTKPRRRAMLEWLQGRILLDVVLQAYVEHNKMTQTLIDFLYGRRQAVLAELASKKISGEQRAALESHSAELKAKLDVFVKEREETAADVNILVTSRVIASPDAPISAPPLSAPTP